MASTVQVAGSGPGELVIGTSRRELERAGVTFRPRLVGSGVESVHRGFSTPRDVSASPPARSYPARSGWGRVDDMTSTSVGIGQGHEAVAGRQ